MIEAPREIDTPAKEAPWNAAPSLIGQVVSIQTFHRSANDEVETDSLCKYVGALEAYVVLPDQFIFKLHGCDAIASLFTEEYVEIYTHS